MGILDVIQANLDDVRRRHRMRDETIRKPGDKGKFSDRENEIIELLMTEGPWPVYSKNDLVEALRIGYELGKLES